jgi:hypothetical protein
MAHLIDLTTVAAVNGILNQGSTVDQGLIQTYITDYSQSVLTRTGRSFLSGVHNYVDRLNGSGSESQALKNYPILAVSLLTVNNIQIPQSPDYVQSGWVIDQDGSQSFLSLVGGNQGLGWAAGNDRWAPHGNWGSYGNAPPLGQSPYRFLQGIQNVMAQYTAGYTVEAYGEPQTVPSTPGPYIVAVNNAANFWQDNGVSLAGSPLEAVTGTPGPGQYSVSGYGTATPGVYTFNAAQQGAAVQISYTYGAPPYDLQQAAGMLVAQQYRRRQWIGQNSQSQPGIGQTNYERAEMDLNTAGIIQRYRDRRLA